MNRTDFVQFLKDKFNSSQLTLPIDLQTNKIRGVQGTIVTILNAHITTAHHVPADRVLLKTIPQEWAPCVRYAEYVSEFWSITMNKPKVVMGKIFLMLFGTIG